MQIVWGATSALQLLHDAGCLTSIAKWLRRFPERVADSFFFGTGMKLLNVLFYLTVFARVFQFCSVILPQNLLFVQVRRRFLQLLYLGGALQQEEGSWQ